MSDTLVTPVEADEEPDDLIGQVLQLITKPCRRCGSKLVQPIGQGARDWRPGDPWPAHWEGRGHTARIVETKHDYTDSVSKAWVIITCVDCGNVGFRTLIEVPTE